MADIRKHPYRLPPGLVPERLVSTAVACSDCGERNSVPWIDKMEFPKQPVTPLTGGGHWVPVSIPLVCGSPRCGRAFQVGVPILPVESNWTLYGDEAGRFIPKPLGKYAEEPLYFFCITLVGLHNSRQDRIRRQIARLKKRIAPDRDPEQWCHHLKDIWNSDARTGEFTLANKEAKIEHAQAFAKVIREARPELVTFNVAGCVHIESPSRRPGTVNALNQEMFCISLLTSLEQMRAHKKGIRWIYDNVKDASTGSRTEGWAMEVFLGLQYTRLFAWLAAGSTILPPEFVKPGSHYLLEVADLVSYFVARDFEKGAQGLKSEFPSSLLGPGLYQAVLADGSIDVQWSRGLPLQRFFGIAQ